MSTQIAISLITAFTTIIITALLILPTLIKTLIQAITNNQLQIPTFTTTTKLKPIDNDTLSEEEIRQQVKEMEERHQAADILGNAP